MTREEYIAAAEEAIEGLDNIGVAYPNVVDIHEPDGEQFGTWVKCWIWIDNSPPEDDE